MSLHMKILKWQPLHKGSICTIIWTCLTLWLSTKIVNSGHTLRRKTWDKTCFWIYALNSKHSDHTYLELHRENFSFDLTIIPQNYKLELQIHLEKPSYYCLLYMQIDELKHIYILSIHYSIYLGWRQHSHFLFILHQIPFQLKIQYIHCAVKQFPPQAAHGSCLIESGW